MVIVPTHFITDPVVVARLEEFARRGGSVVVTCRSGVKDKNGNCILGQELPTLFRKLCGCHVAEYDAIGPAVQELILERGVPVIRLPRGVEATSRVGRDGTFRFFFNNTNHGQSLRLDGQKYHLQPFEVKIRAPEGTWA